MENKERKHPFAYPIKQIATECVFPQLAYLDDMYTGGIGIAEEALQEFRENINATGGQVTNDSAADFLVGEFQGMSRRNVVAHVATILLKDHSLLQLWNEEDKRYFLDLAIQREVNWRQSELAEFEVFRSYHGQDPPSVDYEFPEFGDQIKQLKSLQAKLRQRVSPTKFFEKR